MNKFKENALKIIKEIKNEKFNQYLPQKIPIYDKNGYTFAFLRPITKSSIHKTNEIKLLAKWRDENSFAFPTQFKITVSGTQKWLKGLINEPTRILFFIETLGKKPKLIGHMGLFTFDFRQKSCEIDNVVRGDKNRLKGIMTLALNSLILWTKQNLFPNKIYLKVLSDNKHAIEFYKKNLFKKIKIIPLKKIVKANMIVWKEQKKLKKADKYFIKMKYLK